MISITLIFWNIVEISIETIMKLRLIDKNYDKLISNWIRPYKISVFRYKRGTETLVMNRIEQYSTEIWTHSVIQQMTLQLQGGSYKIIQETQLKENNVRLLYPIIIIEKLLYIMIFKR